MQKQSKSLIFSDPTVEIATCRNLCIVRRLNKLPRIAAVADRKKEKSSQKASNFAWIRSRWNSSSSAEDESTRSDSITAPSINFLRPSRTEKFSFPVLSREMLRCSAGGTKKRWHRRRLNGGNWNWPVGDSDDDDVTDRGKQANNHRVRVFALFSLRSEGKWQRIWVHNKNVDWFSCETLADECFSVITRVEQRPPFSWPQRRLSVVDSYDEDNLFPVKRRRFVLLFL